MIPGKTVLGVIEGDSSPDVFIPPLIESNRRFPFERLIGYYDPDEFNTAARDAEGGTLKPVLRAG
jgi:aryl-alcohol dehydrogenase